MRAFRAAPFKVPKDGEVLLRCQEGEVMVHEDVLCNASERFAELLNSLIGGEYRETEDPSVRVSLFQDGEPHDTDSRSCVCLRR